MTPGLGAVQGTFGSAAVRYGSLTLSIPVADGLRVEAGGDITEGYAAMGSAGVRYTHLSGRLAMDAEFGLGAGAGGALCGNRTDTSQPCPSSQRDMGMSATPPAPLYPDGLTAWDRFAFGGYTGFGLGLRPWRWFEVYARGRLQLSRATQVPTTLWGTAILGIQFKIGPVDLNAAAGWSCYFDERDQHNGIIAEVGLTVPFRVHAP